MYDWGYHSSDEQYVHVSKIVDSEKADDLFDVTLYDPECTDPRTGRNALDQSLLDLRELIGYANAALKAGLTPEPVADRIEDNDEEVARAIAEHEQAIFNDPDPFYGP